MIRFSCPRCKALLERAEDAGGSKFACPGCGQRLQVPIPLAKPTLVQGAPEFPDSFIEDIVPPPLENALRDKVPYQVREVIGRNHVFWSCSLCQQPVDVPQSLGQTTVRCPHCARKIEVPGPALVPGASVPLAGAVPPLPLRKKPRRTDPDRDTLQSLDDEDDNLPRRRFPRSGKEQLQRSAVSGLTCSLVGLGLFVFSFFLGVVILETRNRSASEGLIHVLLLCLLGSFTLGLIGIISSSRGMAPENTQNRGSAISGLVCGILALILSVVLGLFVTCLGIFVVGRFR